MDPSSHHQPITNDGQSPVTSVIAFKEQLGHFRSGKPEPGQFADWVRLQIQAERISRTASTVAHSSCSRDWHCWLTPTDEIEFTSFRCGKKTCPDCADDWSRQLRLELLKAVIPIGTKPLRHVVLTIPSVKEGDLSKGIDQLLDSYRDWVKDGRRKQGRGGAWLSERGIIRKLEVTFDHRKGWHPHLHCLIDAPTGLPLRRGDPGRHGWTRCTARHGAPAHSAVGLFVTAVAGRNAHHTRDASRDSAAREAAGAVREVAKYAAKPLQLRGLSSDVWSELQDSTHGRRFVASSGSLSVKMSSPGGSDLHHLGTVSGIYRKHGMLATPKHRPSSERDPELWHEVATALQKHLQKNPPPKHHPILNILPKSSSTRSA